VNLTDDGAKGLSETKEKELSSETYTTNQPDPFEKN
jgi:hypothetical protein